MISIIEPYAHALLAYKQANGRQWKSQLMNDWLTDNSRQWGTLRQLRNDPRFTDFNDILTKFTAWEREHNA